MAGDHHRELYRWKRTTEPKFLKPAKPPTDDIREWMKRVEEASDFAAAAALGVSKASGTGRAVKHLSIDQLQVHNETYEEAQGLVNEWIASKSELDFDDDLVDQIWSEDSRRNKIDSDFSIDRIVQEATGFGLNNEHAESSKFVADLDNFDEHAATEDILKAMLQKEVVRPEVLTDLGLDSDQATKWRSKQKNPVIKMELRQKQVKENRERRQKETERRRQEIKSKRESLFLAKQEQLKEEKEKIIQAKREEAEIQQEMARIRKELADERRSREEARKIQTQSHAESSPMTPKEILSPSPARDDAACRTAMANQGQTTLRIAQPVQPAAVSAANVGRCSETSKEARNRLNMEKIKVQQARSNLRCLHVHFGAWYSIVLERRAQLGHAAAVADWKQLLRAWNGWRTAVRHSRMDREQLEHEAYLKQLYRKQQSADKFYHTGLLKKYFIEWQLWVIRQQEERNLEEMQHSFRAKMASFLDAASQSCAAVPGSPSFPTGGSSGTPAGNKNKSNGEPNTVLTSKSTTRSGKISSVGTVIPSPKSWPLTRRYEEFMSQQQATQRSSGMNDVTSMATGSTANDGASIESEVLDQDSAAAAAVLSDSPGSAAETIVPKTFASRFAAQQKALREQRRQLQEQQRLIAELRFEQDRRALESQAQQSRLLGEQLQVLAEQLLASRARDASAPAVAGASPATPPTAAAAAAWAAAAAGGGGGKTGGGGAAGGGGGGRGASAAAARNGCRSRTASANSPRADSIAETLCNAEPPALGSLSARSAAAHSNVSSHSRTSTTHSAAPHQNNKFLEAMSERAAARARAKAERDERRRKAEEEKLLQLQAEEEERQRKEEEEKKQQRLQLQERRRLEAQKEAEKQQQAERLVRLNAKATEHSELRLLRHYAWRPWRAIVDAAHEKEKRASAHHSAHLLRNCLLAWQVVAKELAHHRELQAAALYRRHLLTKSFASWKKWRMQAAIMDQKADRLYSRITRQRHLRAWLDYVTASKIETWEKERLSSEHYRLQLIRNAFSMWKQLPIAGKKEKERAKRREELRRKVSMLLPDFDGMSLTSSQESQSTGV